ncbi:tetratricopeptide repeat protein [Streptomyces monticola]|uniref:Tetratricopeptide repeat protein n=1 Tax=Streptomyces monticola TaxID=2666263 RepID=A0ABW2JMJ1_9ACTN
MSGRSRRYGRVRAAGAALVLAGVLSVGGAVIGGATGAPEPVRTAPPAADPARLGAADLDRAVSALQDHLRSQPRDFTSWANLGTAYVEQARTDGAPSRYPQAERALSRSLGLRPGNDAALAARAGLAAARHDFTGALRDARAALTANPYNERALALRIDALVELGRYTQAERAAAEADARRPGIPVFTRYAYVLELRGDTKGAREVLNRGLASASSPPDRAYVATALGRLSWQRGAYERALGHYATALRAAPSYLPALEGRAAARAGTGDTAAAIGDLERVVRRAPLPGPLVALGELYEAKGREAAARRQYALVGAWTSLARASGVNTDLDTALAAADHGDRRAALTAARDEWRRRHTVHTADALAWALHVNGRDAEALAPARRATAHGLRDATLLYHRGVIEQETGHKSAAQRLLSAALDLNPRFSPLGSRDARERLTALRGEGS